MEAIVRGAFPDEPTSTAADLVQLGHRMGFEMPDLSQATKSNPKLDELLRSPPASEAGTSSSSQPALSRDTESTENLAPRQDDGSTSGDEPLGMIRDTAGREHYIGPSGSLQFLGQLRRLLISRDTSRGDGSSSAPSSKFTEDDTAQALETDGNPEDAADPAREQAVQVSTQDGLSPGSINSSIAKDFTRQPFDDIDELLRQLPSQPHIESLLNSYFKNVHEDYPLFHRGTFQEEYEAHFVRLGRPAGRRDTLDSHQPDYGWIGCLHMMLVFGSVSNTKIDDVDHVALRRHCVTVTRKLLPQFVSKCTLSNVRALLLLSLFLHNNNERNAAWNLVGAATRICFALGLHRSDTGTSFRPIEREVRKRVFCTLYGIEQVMASSLGRPSGINDIDVQVTPPREGLLGGGQDGDEDLLSLSLKLQKILSKTRLAPTVASAKALERGADGHRPSTKSVLDLLRDWKLEVSTHRGLDIPRILESGDPPLQTSESSIQFEELKSMLGWQNRTRLRAALLLHLQYRDIAILVTRPYLLRCIQSGRITNSASTADTDKDFRQMADICLENACQLSRIILLLDSFGLINGVSGLDIFYAYNAAMVLILRSLQQPTKNGNGEVDDQELSLLNMLRDLTARVRDAVQRVDKSGTMRRFVRVVTTFEESVYQEKSRRNVPTTGADRQNPARDVQIPIAGNPVPEGAVFDHHLQTQPMLSHHGLVGHRELGGVFPQGDLWSQSNLMTFEGLPEMNNWVGPFLGVGTDTPMLEWGDVETMLGTYGQAP